MTLEASAGTVWGWFGSPTPLEGPLRWVRQEDLLRLVGAGLICNRTQDVEIRRIICSTHAIESLNARFRRAVRARGHFPTE